MEALFNTFVVLFIVIDPVGLAPMFLVLTQGGDALYQRKMAMRGTALATGMLLVFFLVGDKLLAALGIGMPAFRFVGGVLLFLFVFVLVFVCFLGLCFFLCCVLFVVVFLVVFLVFLLAFFLFVCLC